MDSISKKREGKTKEDPLGASRAIDILEIFCISSIISSA